MIQYCFTLFAIGQGSFVLGLTIFIFGYYVPKKKVHLRSNMRWHVLTISSSYIMLTAATIGTAATGLYSWGNFWYWIVTIAYIVGDISLLFIFKEAAKNDRTKSIEEKKQLNEKAKH